MANPIHRTNIVAKDKRSQRKVADSTTELDKTRRPAARVKVPVYASLHGLFSSTTGLIGTASARNRAP